MKLFFIPSSGNARGEWVYQTEYFADSEVVVLPGHPEGRPCPSIDDYVEWLRDDIHQKGYQDVVLVGHSIGGAIAQLYGLRYGDEVKALVLIGTGSRLKVLPSFLASLEAMVADDAAWQKFLAGLYSRVDPEVRRAVIETRTRIGPAVMLADLICCDKFDIMEELHTIKLPVLVICGTKDELTPVKYSHYLTNNIEGATEVIIDDATHLAFAEKPKEVNQAIEKFLGSLG